MAGNGLNFIYFPVLNYRGLDSFAFTVSDATQTSIPATVTVNVGDYGLFTITTLAGPVESAAAWDGLAGAARFNGLCGVALDNTGNLYIVDTANHTIRQISSAGAVTTLAGLAGNPGSADGSGASAGFASPAAVAADNAGNVYVADTGNHTIRKINLHGLVSSYGKSRRAAR